MLCMEGILETLRHVTGCTVLKFRCCCHHIPCMQLPPLTTSTSAGSRQSSCSKVTAACMQVGMPWCIPAVVLDSMVLLLVSADTEYLTLDLPCHASFFGCCCYCCSEPRQAAGADGPLPASWHPGRFVQVRRSNLS